MSSRPQRSAQQIFEEALAKQQAGSLKEASQLYHEVLNRDPAFAEAFHNLGIIEGRGTGSGAALPLFWYATRLRQDKAVFFTTLGNEYMKLSNFADAAEAFRRARSLEPANAIFAFNLAIALHGLNSMQEAIDHFREAIRLNPNFKEAFNNLGNALRLQGNLDGALECFERAVGIDPAYAPSLNGIGNILRDKVKHAESIAYYRRAIEADPGMALAHFNLGNAYRETGATQASIECLRKSLELNPNNADAHRHLAQLGQLSPDDALVAVMEERAANELIRAQDRMQYAFALGTVFDKAKSYDKAFHYLSRANLLKRKTIEYDVKGEWNQLQRIRGMYALNAGADMSNSGLADDTPIFVVGMIRSGTTLTEQILGSHPQIAGAGELPIIQQIVNEWKTKTGKLYPDCLQGITSDDLERMAHRYLHAARQATRPDATHIVDKMPQNFLFIGLIGQMFPKARIIWLKRDPLDNCLSIFSILFTDSHPYAYDLQELGEYYCFSEELRSHWQRLYPGQIYVQQYENLVDDSEAAVRGLLDYCNLPFDPACLEFYNKERVVRTASSEQVRRKINRSSVGRWKGYERHLRDLKRIVSSRTKPPTLAAAG